MIVSGSGPDFLSRLALAEVRDTNQVEPPRAGYAKPKVISSSRRISFHPKVVTGAVEAPNVERSCNEHGVTYYTPREEQEALQRLMVKQHLRECTQRADSDIRTRLNAVAADEAWRRADELWVELRSFEADGLSAPPLDGEALKERQRLAAMRCQKQLRKPRGLAAKVAPAPAPSSRQARPPVATARPGRIMRRESPRPTRPSSPKSDGPTPTQMTRSPCSYAVARTATRVVAPPGGASTLVFG